MLEALDVLPCLHATPNPCTAHGPCTKACVRPARSQAAPPVLRPSGTPMPQRQLAYQAPTPSPARHA